MRRIAIALALAATPALAQQPPAPRPPEPPQRWCYVIAMPGQAQQIMVLTGPLEAANSLYRWTGAMPFPCPEGK